jgi:HK97 family phage prohead protease
MTATLTRHETRARLVGSRAGARGSGKVYRFRASTTAMARDHAVIPATEWRLDNFKRNPVVLLGHDYGSLPVGRAISVTPDADGLLAEVQFDLSDPRGADVARKVDEQFVNAVSVGFRVGTIEPGRGSAPSIFRDVELLEISVVAVPSDPGALVMRRLRARQNDPARAALALFRQYRAELEDRELQRTIGEIRRLIRQYRAEQGAARTSGRRW